MIDFHDSHENCVFFKGSKDSSLQLVGIVEMISKFSSNEYGVSV